MFSHIKEFFTRPSGYTISRSVRLRSSASAYFSRTPASSGNLTTWTLSVWVKRAKLGADQDILSYYTGGLNETIRITSGDQILRYCVDTSGTVNRVLLNTNAVLRDPSAWYHIVVVEDTTQATNTNRVKIYVNGVQQTITATVWPALNWNSYINSTVTQSLFGTQGYTDGYFAEVNFIDGQALTPSSFGSTNAITGVWQPAKYTGTYGTNGFYLNFSDNSNNTATTIGKDYSGNGNNWTPNNISVTAGATYDSMTDVPTLTSATAANYPTWNPLVPSGQAAPTDGNLSQINSAGCRTATIPFPQSGKWYLEWLAGSNTMAIVVGFPFVPTTQANSQTYSVGYYNNGNKYIAGTATAYGASFTSGDIIGLALDFTASPPTITFYKNNASQGAINLTSGIDYVVAAGIGGTGLEVINFGQRPFTYTPPTGYVALNTYNLPASTISNGATVMAATTYTGTGASQTIANTTNSINFKPDLVWIKSRSAATDHKLTDSVRGVTKALISDTTGAETTDANGLTAFGSTGFTVGSDTTYNNNTATYVAWQWQAGQGTTSSNTSGSITSTVSVNATAGFSVVSYTASSSASTIGHGLGVAPSLIIQKNRDAVTDWGVYHISVGPTKYLRLNTTDSASINSVPWNDTTPTSTVFSIGTGYTNGNKYVAYCWAAVKGFSAFGSYTGNGSADGPFAYCGFRPRWVMVKRTDSTENWYVHDSARDTYNQVNTVLYPNLSNAEGSSNANMDFTSNGFKIRESGTASNASGGTYIYAAFAEVPFKAALAR